MTTPAHDRRARSRDEQGQTLAEYAVVLTVITSAIALALGLLATNLGTHITNIAKLVGP